MRKFNKKYLIGIAVMTLGVGMVSSLNAANAIDPTRECSLTIQLDQSTEYGTDLKDSNVNVELYKIADMADSGAFTSTDSFKELKIEDIPSGEEHWDTTATDAKEIVERDSLSTDGTIEVKSGTGTLAGLSKGLYLVLTEDTTTDEYLYTFKPFIISLPNNYYYQTKDEKDDAWVYEVRTGLKPERSDRYGSLKITKTLNEYNESLKKTTFVFSVEGKKNDEVVYSNVVSTTFDSTGSKEVTLDKIPAGCTLTVTEVYSGASYTISGDSTQTIEKVIADEVMEADFTNTYNDELKPGYGVTNHFELNGEEWNWTQLTDNTQQ